ncbi:MAG: DNA ligase (NAD(+)) LigA [Candidatus Heimdallarchaeota archaeon]|nr:DNA ligase (NAD(+)) LigA [Candidatus Heimdallarchaeota archaeon]
MQGNSSESEIQRLVDHILYHKKKYYNGEPVISDAEYDAIEEKLRILDPDNPVLYIVGTPEGGKVIHDTPMLSCQKAGDIEEVLKWSKGLDLLVEYKIDGFSLSLIYVDGKLIQAATRGNATAGDDVTIDVMKIPRIPKKVPVQARINIRGEIYMKISEFKRIKREEGFDYNSPRNLAVGTLKQKNLKLLTRRKLNFFAFELIGYDDEADLKIKNQILNEWGFETAFVGYIEIPTETKIKEIFRQVEEDRNTLDFEIDGLVLKYNAAKERSNAGSTAHHPKWMIALKFESQGDITSIESITWQVGRTGSITPVAELKPIEIAGAVIKRATLHNAEFMESLNAAPGDKVLVVRSGDVIPKIIEVNEKGALEPSFPVRCPSCDSKLERVGVNLKCQALICRDREIQRIRHWVKITEIMGLGVKNIARLYDEGIVRHFSDLYDKKLSENILVNILGKNGAKIYESIQNKRELPFSIFLAALGIDSLGTRMAKVLAHHFQDFNSLKSADAKDLMKIEGISDITADYIIKGLQDSSLAEQVLSKGLKLNYSGKRVQRKEEKKTTLETYLPSSTKKPIKPEPEFSTSHNNENSISIYVSGKIEGLTKRELQDILSSHGYEWAPLTKKLDLLVLGEKPGSKKIEKAKQYGIKIETWDKFSKKIHS